MIRHKTLDKILSKHLDKHHNRYLGGKITLNELKLIVEILESLAKDLGFKTVKDV